MSKNNQLTLNKDICLESMISKARDILAEYKKAKYRQCEFLFISNDGYLSVPKSQEKLNGRVDELREQLFDVLMDIQKFKKSKEISII